MPVRALGETASRAPQEINLECAAEHRHYLFFVGEEGGPRFWRVQSNEMRKRAAVCGLGERCAITRAKIALAAVGTKSGNTILSGVRGQ
jgi:hypothetical protein